MKLHLTTKKVDFRYVDVTQDEAAFNWVTEMGYQGVPVTVIGFTHFQGFDPDRANAALDRMMAA